MTGRSSLMRALTFDIKASLAPNPLGLAADRRRGRARQAQGSMKCGTVGIATLIGPALPRIYRAECPMADHPHTIAMDMPLPIDMRAPSLGRFLCDIESLPAFDLTEHATKSARAIRNLDHAVGDHRDRCPCPDHHCRRLVRNSVSCWALNFSSRTRSERPCALACPLLFRLPLHSRCLRVLELEPVQRATIGSVSVPLLLPRLERDDDLFPGLQVFQLDHTVRISDFRICAACKARSF